MELSEVQNIILIGPMATGKTTVGKKLANKLNVDFIDTDHAIERQQKKSISSIFSEQGEEKFRHLESVYLAEIANIEKRVIATGGGIILSAHNRNLLLNLGVIVYLTLSLEKILERTKYNKKRPLLMVNNREEILEKVLRDREPLYQQIADVTIYSEQERDVCIIEQILYRIRTCDFSHRKH